MIEPWAHTIYWVGICGALLASFLSLSRLWTSNQNSPLLCITAAAANLIVTLFYFFILWLALIITAPQENHSLKIFLGWLGAGLLPSLLALSSLMNFSKNSENPNTRPNTELDKPVLEQESKKEKDEFDLNPDSKISKKPKNKI